MTNGTMEIHFKHPRTSKILVADLSSQCTAREALQALMGAEDNGTPFLTQSDGDAYNLIHERTSQLITPNMTFGQAGVANGDTIKIDKDMKGAQSIVPPAHREEECHNGETDSRRTPLTPQF